MAILSEGCKPDNFESHNSLKVSYKYIWPIYQSNSCDILVLCETNLDYSIDSGNFSVMGFIIL